MQIDGKSVEASDRPQRASYQQGWYFDKEQQVLQVKLDSGSEKGVLISIR